MYVLNKKSSPSFFRRNLPISYLKAVPLLSRATVKNPIPAKSWVECSENDE